MESNIGNRIKKLRELKNLTQEYMAESLKMSQAGYGKIERGETDVNYSRLQQIAEALGIKMVDLISFDEQCFFKINNKIKADVNNGFVFNDVSDGERKSLYEQIELVKKENAYLKEIIEFFKQQSKDS